jgi:hypothetical protein
MQGSRCKAFHATILLLITIASQQLKGQHRADSHRPPCTTPRCKAIKAYLKSHYCGKSPFGNGPSDGCEIRLQKTPGVGITVSADFSCRWSETEGKSKCQQRGQPPKEIRDRLIHEMEIVGLQGKADPEVNFSVWEATSSGLSLVNAEYEHTSGAFLAVCQVIAVIDRSGQLHILRTLPFQKTDADVPRVTRWFPIALADVDHDGQLEIVLEGDAYENDWLEVVGMQDGSFKTLFSGLGYYL